MRKTAIYARQSIDKKDSVSIEAQINECKKFASDGASVVIFSDKGCSGKNTDRPQLKDMILSLENGEIEKIIVYKLDRISRNITDFYNLYEKIKQNDCAFFSASEQFDTSQSMGRAMMGILAVFAQMERENIQTRVKDNYYYRTEKDGSWPGGPAPFGFKNGLTENRKKTLVPVNDETNNEVSAVKYLFETYANEPGTSLGSLAKKIFKLGFKSRKRDLGLFDSVTISRILKNTVYVKADSILYNYLRSKGIKVLGDKEKWDGSTSAHIIGKKATNKTNKREYSNLEDQTAYLTNFKGFIDSSTYIKVQQRLESNKQIKRSNGTSKLQEFSGKLKCGQCGYAVKIYNGETLSCYGRVSMHCCNSVFKYGIPCEDVTLDYVRTVVSSHISKYYSLLKYTYEAREKENESVKEKIKKYEKKIENLTDSLEITDEKPARDTFLARINENAKKISDLQISLQGSNDISSLEINEKINYYSLSIEQRKEIINLLIDKILIYDPYSKISNHRVVIKWKHDVGEKYQDMFDDIYFNLSKEEQVRLDLQAHYSMSEVPDSEVDLVTYGVNSETYKRILRECAEDAKKPHSGDTDMPTSHKNIRMRFFYISYPDGRKFVNSIIKYKKRKNKPAEIIWKKDLESEIISNDLEHLVELIESGTVSI